MQPLLCLWQVLTGKGALGQLQLELGLPSYAVDLLVLGVIGYSFVGGLNPKSPTFSEQNQRDVRKRGAGAHTSAVCITCTVVDVHLLILV